MSLEQIKNLRDKTGAGIVDVKKALQEAGGDAEKAIMILRKKGQEKAIKKSERSAKEGVIASYIHSNGKVGAMVKLFCETDFVARTDEFKELARDLAMHITAANPKYLKPDQVPAKIIEKEKEIWVAQLEREGKPKNIIRKALEGKEKKFREETALLTQPFIKNPDLTIGEIVAEKIGKIGENIQIGDFSRFEL
ncbi:MAG TPA: translation elongation factor Ts [Patescibacteria group bacterium]